jgi:tetratricopeptide (TPR) repeat protein
MAMTRRLVPLMAVCATFLLTASCLLLPRYRPVERRGEPYPAEKLAEEMDPWLLAEGFGERLIVEIDWVDGCRPGERTLAGFDRILRRYVPSDRELQVTLDEEIPQSAWEEASKKRDPVKALVEQFAGVGPVAESGTERRYVLFVPEFHGFFGYSTAWTVERAGTVVPVQGVVVAREAHEEVAKMWLDRDKIERGTLIHEFGHQFGLVTNDQHERSHPEHRRHCTQLKCLMSHPTARVIMRNAAAGLFNVFPKDYCSRCQEDISRAKDYWRRRVAEDPEYRSSILLKREAWRARVALGSLYENERYGELLARVRTLREQYPGAPGWDSYEASALLGLGRVDEALVLLQRALQADPEGVGYWNRRWRVGRILIGLGRHDEAVRLFETGAMERSDPYDFEQSTFILVKALTGLGRYGEAVRATDELLRRGHSLAFDSEGLRVHRSVLLRRAGRLDEAEEAVAAGLAKRKTRGAWLEAAAELRRAQGRDSEARSLLEERLAGVEGQYSASSDAPSRWRTGWESVRLLAETGAGDRARTLASELAAKGIPDEIHLVESVYYETSAWIALGELDRAAALLRGLSVEQRGLADPCGREALEPLRQSPDHAILLEHCPERLGAGS